MLPDQQERVSLFHEATMPREPSSRKAGSPYGARRPKYDYKPVVLRTLPLLCLTFFAVILIGLLQVAVMRMPHGDNRLDGNVAASINRRRASPHVQARQDAVTTSAPASDFVDPSESVPRSSGTFYAPSSNYLDQTANLPPPPSSNYLDQTATLPPPFTTSGAYLNNIETITLYTATSAYVAPDATQTILGTTPESNYVDTSPTGAVPPSNYVDPSLPGAVPPSNYVDPTNGVTITAPTPVTETTVVISSSATAVVRTFTSGGMIAYTTESSAVLVTMTLTTTSLDNQATGPALLPDGKPAVVVVHWSDAQVFFGTYMAVLLAVIYRIIFAVVHNNMILIDPFLQLMQPGGALSKKALFGFYHNQSFLLGPIPALSKGRWALALVGTGYAVACLIPALASEAVWVDTHWECPYPKPSKQNPCPARLTTSVVVVRVLQGLLGFTAVVLLSLAVILMARKTGLPSDPSSIATISSLMKNPRLMEDLNEMPVGVLATADGMKRALAGKRYALGRWKNSKGGESYGIRPVAYNENDELSSSERSSMTFAKGSGAISYIPVDSRSSFNDADVRSHNWRWMDLILAIAILGTFGVVLAYYLDFHDDPFNRYFSSNTFGPRFILTLAGTIIANIWNSVELSAVVIAPFIRLSQKPTPSPSTISFRPTNTPILSTWRTLRHGYIFAAIVTVMTMLGEALNIVISGVPFATGQTWKQFLVSAYLSLAILGTMILVSILVLLHRRREPRIPVHPDNLAAKMSYLVGSRMLDDFEGTEHDTAETSDEHLRLLGKKYRFEPRVRNDGQKSWLVDQVQENGESYQGYQDHHAHQNYQDHQRYESRQGHQRYESCQGHQRYESYQGHQRQQSYEGDQGYPGYQAYQGH